MHDIRTLLHTFRRQGAHIWSENRQLRYRALIGALSPDDLNTLRSLKAQILCFLESNPTLPAPPLTKRLPHEAVPITFQQQWLLNKIEEQSFWHFSLGYALRLIGSLNVELLRKSIAAVCCRHEALRTRIVFEDGSHSQRIDETYSHDVVVEQIVETSKLDCEQKARFVTDEFIHTPLDLSAGPLFRTKLLKIGDCDHILLLAVDHLISDGVSMRVLLDDLRASYAQLEMQSPSSLPDIPIQYADYAVWQRKHEQFWNNTHNEYWKNRLSHATPICFPVDRKASETTLLGSGAFEIKFTQILSVRLRELAKFEQTTLARLVLTSFVSCLSRLCNTSDLVVPFNAMSRDSALLQRTIGYFPHIIYLRIELTVGDTLRDVLTRVTSELTAAFEHDDLGRMVTLRPDLLSGLWFQWEPWWNSRIAPSPSSYSGRTDLPNNAIEVSFFPIGPRNVEPEVKGNIDMGFLGQDGDDGIIMSGSYRRDLFSATSMDRLARNLLMFARTFVENPRACVADISLVE
jgi:hypothetical protein